MPPFAVTRHNGWTRLLVWAAAALCIVAVPAQAQRSSSDVGTVVLRELSIVKTKDMDFGIISGPAAGTIVMTATQTPTCTASAGLVHAEKCQPATFVGKGTRLLQPIRIRRPPGNVITLTGPGANMRVTNLVFNGGTDLIFVSQSGRNSRYLIATLTEFFTIRLGGTLNVGAAQAPGEYTGTFEVDITYT